jgi:hypothetical protein
MFGSSVHSSGCRLKSRLPVWLKASAPRTTPRMLDVRQSPCARYTQCGSAMSDESTPVGKDGFGKGTLHVREVQACSSNVTCEAPTQQYSSSQDTAKGLESWVDPGQTADASKICSCNHTLPVL